MSDPSNQIRSNLRTRRIQRFMKKRKLWFTIIGTFIIAATYVVKDAWREGLKDDADTINYAINVLLSKQDGELRTSNVEQIQSQIADLKLTFQAYAATKGAKAPEPVEPDLGKAVMPIYRSLSNLTEYFSTVPDKEGEFRMIELSDKFVKLESLRSQYEYPNGDLNPKLRSTQLFLQVRIGITALLTEVETFQISVITSATRKKADSRARYVRATHWSYLLFGVGLLFNLLPKLFGADEEGKSDEPV
jgi:hypothetical protein